MVITNLCLALDFYGVPEGEGHCTICTLIKVRKFYYNIII